LASRSWLDGDRLPRTGREVTGILVERAMNSRFIIIGGILAQDPT
jgi:hypothetical protein